MPEHKKKGLTKKTPEQPEAQTAEDSAVKKKELVYFSHL